MKFHNRSHAGFLLADKMTSDCIDKDNTVVIAVTRGGIPVAFEVAKRFHLPLDIILIKKIGAPTYPELEIGTINEYDEVFYNETLIDELGIDINSIKNIKDKILYDLIKNGKSLRGNHPPLSLFNKNIILVDDGINTGATVESALLSLKKRGINKIIIVSPVASAETMLLLKKKVNSLIVLKSPNHVYSISEWYEDFKPVETAEVVRILNNYFINADKNEENSKMKALLLE